MNVSKTHLLLFVLALGLLGGVALVSGIVPVRASDGHWAITRWFLDFAKKRSVATHAIGTEVPDLDDPRLVLIGAGHYETGCRYCHGTPGIRMPRVTGESTPHPPPLYASAQTYAPAELFEIVAYGIKFTGMPAWPSPQRADEVWAMVAFLQVFGALEYDEYQAMVFGGAERSSRAPFVVRFRCARCHGEDGLGVGEDAFPRLAGQSEAYLVDALRAYARGQRHSGLMEPLAAELSDADLVRAAAWYAAQPLPALPLEDTPDTDTTAPPSDATALPRGDAPGSGASAPSRDDASLLPAERLARGAAIATHGVPDRRIPPCQECHDGTARPEYPRLHGQPAPYLAQQLRLWYEGRRGGGRYAEVMQVVAAHPLEPDEIAAVAAFYASAD